MGQEGDNLIFANESDLKKFVWYISYASVHFEFVSKVQALLLYMSLSYVPALYMSLIVSATLIHLSNEIAPFKTFSA